MPERDVRTQPSPGATGNHQAFGELKAALQLPTEVARLSALVNWWQRWTSTAASQVLIDNLDALRLSSRAYTELVEHKMEVARRTLAEVVVRSPGVVYAHQRQATNQDAAHTTLFLSVILAEPNPLAEVTPAR